MEKKRYRKAEIERIFHHVMKQLPRTSEIKLKANVETDMLVLELKIPLENIKKWLNLLK